MDSGVNTLSPWLLALCLIVLSLGSSCGNRDGQTSDRGAATAGASTNNEQQDSIVIDLTGEDSVSALALLQRDHNVLCKSTAMGSFVTAIDGVKYSRHAYWMYTVNDTTPPVASDKLITKSGDRVRWHFRKQK